MKDKESDERIAELENDNNLLRHSSLSNEIRGDNPLKHIIIGDFHDDVMSRADHVLPILEYNKFGNEVRITVGLSKLFEMYCKSRESSDD